MANEWQPNDIFDILGDERVQAIFQLTARRSMSATELIDELDASSSSIYRRISVLTERNLLHERNSVERDGNHYNVYQPNFDHATIRLDDTGLSVAVYDDGDLTYTEPTTDRALTDSPPNDGLAHD